MSWYLLNNQTEDAYFLLVFYKTLKTLLIDQTEKNDTKNAINKILNEIKEERFY